MRFIHTADWQIGMKANYIGAAAEKVRQKRLETANRLVKMANENKVDFILIAGDTFEDNGVEHIMIQKVADTLGNFHGPVYILPGNHDPLVPGSVWEHPAWGSHSNLQILRKEEPLAINGGVLYPCPSYAKTSNGNPLKWINADESKEIAIGIAHGTVEGINQQEPDYPIPRDAASRTGLDYIALGHWHSKTLYEDADGICRMAYSGTHEQTKFGERDAGNILLLEISERNKPPQISPILIGELTWLQFEENVIQSGDLERLHFMIEKIDHPENTLVDFRVNGIAPVNELSEITRISEVMSRFLFGRVGNRVIPSPQDDSWLSILPVGVLRESAQKLHMFADSSYSGERPDGCSVEVATRALLELYTILSEAK